MDGAAYRWFNRLADHTGWAHTFFVDFAKYGVGLFAVLLLVGWWYAARRDDGAPRVVGVMWAGAAALIAVAVDQVIGHIVNRARPFVAMPTMHVLVSHSKDASFPSDHAAIAGAVAVGLFLVFRWLGWVAIALALLMAFARVYVGVHYPGDVLGGLALGGVIALAGAPLVHRLADPAARRLARGPLHPLLSR